MPRGDGTGPNGAGPMTGRALGYCTGYVTPGHMNPPGGYGRRRGPGRGWGRGFGRGRFVCTLPVSQPVYRQTTPITQKQSPEQEVAALENYQKQLEAEKADLEQEMGGVKSRIEELKIKLEK